MRYGFLKDASFDPQSSFYTCILRLEFQQVGQFKDYRFLLILISFLLAGPRLFNDVPFFRLRPQIPIVGNLSTDDEMARRRRPEVTFSCLSDLCEVVKTSSSLRRRLNLSSFPFW